MAEWKDATHILCIRPDNMGDVLMTTPAIRALKNTRDDRQITLLTSRSGAEIARYIPEIDDVMVFDLPWVKHGQIEKIPSIDEIVKEIRNRQFDSAVIFTNFSQNPLPSVFSAYLAEIPLRLSYCRENPYNLLTDWVPDREPLFQLEHGVKRQLDLVETIGAKTIDTDLSLIRPGIGEKKITDKLEEIGLDTQSPWIIMHVGASEEKRIYPPKNFAEVGQKIIKDLDFQILFTGTVAEQELVDRVRSDIDEKTFSLAGDMTLEELIAAMDETTLLISNNTGPVHIASALNTPVVVLYANTNPEHTPWNVPNRVLYFEPPEKLQSKNQILSWAITKLEKPMPDPTEVVASVQDLLDEVSDRISGPGYTI